MWIKRAKGCRTAITLKRSRARGNARCKSRQFFVLFFRRPQPRTRKYNGRCNGRTTSRYLTEPECNGSAEHRLKEGTPVSQNRPGIEPGPRKRSPPNGASEQSGVQGLLYYYKLTSPTMQRTAYSRTLTHVRCHRTVFNDPTGYC